MGCSSANEESSETIFSYCFREDEISHITKLKEEKDGTEKGDEISILYDKIEIDFTKEEKIFKEYIVLYLPKKFSKHSITFEYSPMINLDDEMLEPLEINQYPKYAKKNNSSSSIKRFECTKEYVKDEGPHIKSILEIKVHQNDRENSIITIEIGYNLKYKKYFGLYHLSFGSFSNPKPATYSLIYDNQFTLNSVYNDLFTEVSKSHLYIFNCKEYISLSLRDKRVRINIEDEFDRRFLSKFSDDEIEQINFSLNEMKIGYNDKNLIYQKAIHNIKNNKDYMKIYCLVFFPNLSSGSGHSYTEDESIKPIIINRIRVNNILVKRKDIDENTINGDEENSEEGDENDEPVDGYYISDNKKLILDYNYLGTFAVHEFECESNKNVNYFLLESSSDLNFFLRYGCSYKYEIRLNGNNIKFSTNNFSYSVINDVITLKGYFNVDEDNYNEKEYIELAKREDPYFDINEIEKQYRPNYWRALKNKQLVPEKMSLVR